MAEPITLTPEQRDLVRSFVGPNADEFDDTTLVLAAVATMKAMQPLVELTFDALTAHFVDYAGGLLREETT